MPTLTLKEETLATGTSAPFDPKAALDLDGHTEFELYVNVPEITGGTLSLDPVHSTRNRIGDYFGLGISMTFTSAGITRHYITEFARYLNVKLTFQDSAGSNYARYEMLVVPKRR